MQWSLDELLLHPLYRAVLLILKLGDVIFSLKTLQWLFLKYLWWSTRSYIACPALLPFLLSHGLLGSPGLVTVATLACILFVLLGNPLPTSGSSLVAQLVKNPPAMREIWVWSLDWEDPLEKGKATHSSILAWRIPWTVYSRGSQRVRHDWTTFFSLY